MNGTALAVKRIAAVLPKARLEHGLSPGKLARLSAVLASTISKTGSGCQVDGITVMFHQAAEGQWTA